GGERDRECGGENRARGGVAHRHGFPLGLRRAAAARPAPPGRVDTVGRQIETRSLHLCRNACLSQGRRSRGLGFALK
ncbi:hypothetical protein ACX84U_24140, partial [Burkholderia pseudomallei]